MSLLTHLAQVPDYRRPGGNFRHPLLLLIGAYQLRGHCEGQAVL